MLTLVLDVLLELLALSLVQVRRRNLAQCLAVLSQVFQVPAGFSKL